MLIRYLVISAALLVGLGLAIPVGAQDLPAKKFDQADKFRQLEEILPSPNAYRTASGAPGHGYWQQRADYDIDVEVDDANQRIIGSESIRYTNHSPDTLKYLWLQIDNNIFDPNSDANLTSSAPDFEDFSHRGLRRLLAREDFDGSVTIHSVRDAEGADLPHTIVKTMLRVDLPQPLAPGGAVTFSVDWSYNINNSKLVGGRTGYEFFEEDGNYLYEIAHWFPRMACYTDVNGWQHKQFIGSGEFTLEFGDYRVRITAPDDHIVAATGVLQNPDAVLTATQRERLERARTAKTPVFVVTPQEAEANESSKPKGKKTWVYHAQNVRDFAFASSRKFIWDALGHQVDHQHVMAMSYYPKEGEPLWSRYSTHSIVHTLDVYSKYTFTYPYPIAISVNGPIGGMEYPMICFNGPRPEKDGTYTARTKYGLISVIIHEVGHNYFPMIVNSDERQWTWMDEGLNTFLQFLTEQEWEEEYPSRRGEAAKITTYMASENQVPIMTNSESLQQFGNNAYAKPATALNILRESILGRDLFDFAFKEYARRWQFKRPQPADFFRTMEDASGVDLDWFWRGWFYSTDHCDIGIQSLTYHVLETGDPEIDKTWDKEQREARPETLTQKRNTDLPKRTLAFPELKDFYNDYDELDVTPKDRESYEEMLAKLEDWEKDLLKTHRHFYALQLENHGGLVMPVILRVGYADGSTEELRIPAEIWRRNNEATAKLFLSTQEITSIELDPREETADVNRNNNYWPPRPAKSRFKLFKRKKEKNPMQQAQDADAPAAAGTPAEATSSSGTREKF